MEAPTEENADQIHAHGLTGRHHGKVHAGKRTGKSRAHSVTRFYTCFMEHPHTKCCHIGPRGGPLGLQRTGSGGDFRIGLSDETRFMNIVSRYRNAPIFFITPNSGKIAFQPFRRFQLQVIIGRGSRAGAPMGSRRRGKQHQHRRSQKFQYLFLFHSGNTRIPCHIISSTRIPTTTLNESMDFTTPCFSISLAIMPGTKTPIMPGS